MPTDKLRILLADDDEDDCIFFREALDELGVGASLTTVGDGVKLMQHLAADGELSPHILYLDLNMPRKNGYECLSEIKGNERLRHLPVVIYSTSLDRKVADGLYERGADYYIRKPAMFSNLKMAIGRSIELISVLKNGRPSKENFIIASE